jgi:hypothetical protein
MLVRVIRSTFRKILEKELELELDAYGIPKFFRLDVRKSNGKVNQVQVDVAQSPSLVLGLCHLQGMLALVVIVPQFGGDEDVFTLDEAFIDGSLDPLASLFFVLVVIGTVKEAVALFDGL